MMLTILATFLTYLATKAGDKGWPRLVKLFGRWHWTIDQEAQYRGWKLTCKKTPTDKFCTILYKVSQWFEYKGKYGVATKIDEIRWWFEGVGDCPAWIPNIWKWYKRSRWLVLCAGPVVLLLLLVLSIYLTMIQMALAVVFSYLGLKGTLAALWFATSVFWCTIGFNVGRRFKV